jgi:hypothetical protein
VESPAEGQAGSLAANGLNRSHRDAVVRWLKRCVLNIAQCVVRSRVNEASMTKEFYTVNEMADLLRIRPGTVRNRVSQRRRDVPPSISLQPTLLERTP